MKTRIYIISEKDSDTVRMIEAASQAQAIRCAIKGRFTVTVANALEVAELMKAGAQVEEADGDD